MPYPHAATALLRNPVSALFTAATGSGFSRIAARYAMRRSIRVLFDVNVIRTADLVCWRSGRAGEWFDGLFFLRDSGIRGGLPAPP